MSSWGNNDNAANAPYWAVSTVINHNATSASAPTAANVALLYGNTQFQAYTQDTTVGLFMVDSAEMNAGGDKVTDVSLVNYGSGGGGGYSGGGAGTNNTDGGGGGGSYNGGINQTAISGTNTGAGLVKITRLCNISLSASTVNSLVPYICVGQTMTLTTNAASGYSWSTGNTTNSTIVVSPTVTTTYSVTGTSTQNCVTSAVITVTVNGGAPVLTLSASSNTVCLGQSATLTANGALSYTWTGGVSNGVGFTPSVTQVYTVTGQNGCGNTTSTINLGVGPIPVSIGVTPTISCSNQPVTLSATAAAVAYTWMPGNLTASNAIVSPSATTVYTITVSNGTCNGTGTVNLSVNPVPTIGIVPSATNGICAGTSATLTASGGISYTWTPVNSNNTSIIVTPTTTSGYSVAGSNSFGCVSGAYQVIQTVAAPNIQVSATSNYVCAGTQVSLTATGANTYTWANPVSNNNVVTITPSVGATYTVSGSNASGCTSFQTVFVDVFIPTVTVAGTTVVCSGKAANITGNGADTYQWNGASFSNGNSATFNPTATTIYTVSTTTFSNGVTCPNTVTFQITVNPKPNIQPSATRSVICKGETTTITVTGASTYTWTNVGNNATTFVITGSVVTTTNYSVSGTDANGCVNGAQLIVTINACSGVDKIYSENAISIYPNPSHGEFSVQSSKALEMKIINELGQVIKLISLNGNNNYKMEVNGIPSGIYFITNEKANFNQKMIIEK